VVGTTLTSLLTPVQADASTTSLDTAGESPQEKQVSKPYTIPQKNPIEGTRTAGTSRFRVLVPKKDNKIAPAQLPLMIDPLQTKKSPKHAGLQEMADSLRSTLSPLDFPCEGTVILRPISLPPSVAQRKHIPRLALILSGISLQDLKTCALVSRSFRYAGIIFHYCHIRFSSNSFCLVSLLGCVSPITAEISGCEVAAYPFVPLLKIN